MGIVERIRSSLSPRIRLLRQFAETAGRAETLAANLARHAELCIFPTLKAGLEQLTAAEATQANAMRELLFENGSWPQTPKPSAHDGSNNWERLRSDLDLQVEILRALHFQLAEWASIDAAVADRLRQFAEEEDRNIWQLRDLTLKCDPQALD
ncbi:MAG TPA: hypothetical protein VJN94_12560 [Candidatus Binataceae bacterium]|nr:hypothetical protein [Candidatus Binataceae bacterium]